MVGLQRLRIQLKTEREIQFTQKNGRPATLVDNAVPILIIQFTQKNGRPATM